MTIRQYPTIRLSRFGAATARHATVEDIFQAWLSGKVPGVQSEAPCDVNLWHTLINQAITPALPPLQERKGCGLILATTKGDMRPVENWLNGAGDQLNSKPPPLLSEQLQIVKTRYALGGPHLLVSTACSSGLTAIIEAAMIIQAGEAMRMVVCGADIADGFIRDGFNALKAITKSGCRPFDRQRDGLVLGSAAAACLVTRGDIVSPADAGPSVELEGWGIAGDAAHLTAPDKEASGLMRALKSAISGVEASSIDAVVLHGTGTAYNDAMEALAMRTIFNHYPCLTGIKGLLGHTLGASGVIETAMVAWMLHKQVVPAITGLENPQWPELNFVHNAPAARPLKRIVKTASGFGGLNAVIMCGMDAGAGQ
jgi:3-oxoacyl-(acyl-carrier-protein) synthase